MTQLGPQLRERRNAQKFSLREVERRSGINSGYLSQLERGDIASPTPSVLQKVAKAYDVPFQIVMRWAGYVEDGLSANAQRALSVLGDDFTDQEVEALKAVLDVMRSKEAALFSSVHRTHLVLAEDEVDVIRAHAIALLREVADHRGAGPVDLDNVTTHAKLVRTGQIELTLKERNGLRARFGELADRAVEKLQGLVHFGSREVYVNPQMYHLKQHFVLAHEIGHWVLPDHKATYAALDDSSRLKPEFNDRLERQANQFGIELLARGDRLRQVWDDSTPSAKHLAALSSDNAISLQAVARRVAEQSQRPLAIAIGYRGGSWAPMSATPSVFCSSSWDQRLGWNVIGAPVKELSRRLREVTNDGPQEALTCVDLAGRQIDVQVEALDTARACFLICWIEPTRRRFRRV